MLMPNKFILMLICSTAKCVCVSVCRVSKHCDMRSTIATLIWQMCTAYGVQYTYRRCAITLRGRIEMSRTYQKFTTHLFNFHENYVLNRTHSFILVPCTSYRKRRHSKNNANRIMSFGLFSVYSIHPSVAHWHQWVLAILPNTCPFHSFAQNTMWPVYVIIDKFA